MGWINKSVAVAWRAGQFASALPWFSEKTPRPGAADDFWYEGFGGRETQSGMVVSPQIALKASAVYAVVKVLAETMATMPLQMYRDMGAAGREPAPNHPLDELIRYQPNQSQTAVEFWEFMMLNAVLEGTGYAEIVPGRRGAVDQLLPIRTSRVKAERLSDGTLRFKISEPNGTTRVLLQEEMFRFPGLSGDGITGLRVVDLAAEDIGLGMAADAYASRVFSNKLNIGGFLIHPATLTSDAQKNLINSLMRTAAGIENAHRPIVLQEGMKFERGSDTAKDAQLLEARKWQVTLVAQRFRVPLHMLGIDDQTNRATVEAQAIDFVKYTLRPWARRIEQAIRRDLIVATGIYSAKFNMDALMRGDSLSRAEYFAKALGSGGHPPWMTSNEVRVIEGMNPIAGGDKLVMPTNAAPNNSGLTDDSQAAQVKKLVAKEAAAMRKSALRLAGDADAFREWVAVFFGGHVSTVTSLLSVTKDVAKQYCDHAKAEVLAANDLPGMLDRWDDGRADEIIAMLEPYLSGR